MLPVPVPALVTVSVGFGVGEKVAVADDGDAPNVIVQVVAVPEHAPLQPPNNDAGEAGVAVNVIWLPTLKLAEHVAAEQLLMPAGELLTDPEPVPEIVTATVEVAALKLAVTDCIAFIVTVQVAAVPEQPPPLQPENTYADDDGVSVRVTTVPLR